LADDVTQPVFVAACRYAEAPGAMVYFLRWADLTQGPGWVEALRNSYPLAPGFESDRWQTGTVDQGAIVSMVLDAQVQINACFDRAPVCVSVSAGNVETATTAWNAWRSVPQ